MGTTPSWRAIQAGGGAVGDEPAGHPLHSHKAHALGPAPLHQLLVLGAGEVTVRELEGGVQPGVHGFPGHGQPVVGDADVADFPLGLGFQGGVVKTVLPAGPGDEGGVVELIEVDKIGAQLPQAGFQVLPQLSAGLGVGLGGDDHLVPDAGEGEAHLLLAVGVGPGGVEVVDPAVHRFAQQAGRFLLGDALNGQASKAVFLDLDTGGT